MSRRNRAPRVHTDRYRDVAAARRHRDDLATRAERAEAMATDPELLLEWRRANGFVWVTADQYAADVARLDPEIDRQDARIGAVRDAARRDR